MHTHQLDLLMTQPPTSHSNPKLDQQVPQQEPNEIIGISWKGQTGETCQFTQYE